MLSAALVSCEKTKTDPSPSPSPSPKTDPEESEDYRVNKCLRDDIMSVYYYWAEEVYEANKKLDLNKYSIFDAFDAMLYKDDRWSFMESGESYLAVATGAISGTWGLSLAQRSDCREVGDYNVYVKYIFPESPLAAKGVTRGARLTGIKGLDMPDHGFNTTEQIEYFNEHLYDSPQIFNFTLTNGEKVAFELEMPESVNTNYILSSQIFDGDDFDGLAEPVGYFNYLSFKLGFISDLDAAFAEFKKAGVKKMIVDLRYNGGGDGDASQRLISYLAPAGLQGKPYRTRKHNNLLSSQNASNYIGKLDGGEYTDISIGLDEIFFIMDNSSASASELVFNGLRPYMRDNLHFVGKQTYGKPNGMYVLFYPGDEKAAAKYDKGDYSGLKWVFYPICFFNVNSAGEFIPYGPKTPSGFLPDNERPDDILHDFGVDEDRVKACLNYIVTGSYPDLPETKSLDSVSGGVRGIKVESLAPEWQTNPHYGTDEVVVYGSHSTF